MTHACVMRISQATIGFPVATIPDHETDVETIASHATGAHTYRPVCWSCSTKGGNTTDAAKAQRWITSHVQRTTEATIGQAQQSGRLF